MRQKILTIARDRKFSSSVARIDEMFPRGDEKYKFFEYFDARERLTESRKNLLIESYSATSYSSLSRGVQRVCTYHVVTNVVVYLWLGLYEAAEKQYRWWYYMSTARKRTGTGLQNAKRCSSKTAKIVCNRWLTVLYGHTAGVSRNRRDTIRNWLIARPSFLPCSATEQGRFTTIERDWLITLRIKKSTSILTKTTS